MTDRPDCIVHWSDIEEAPWHYQNDKELMAQSAPFGQHFGLKRVGIHHFRIPPGRRTSFPHAESVEDEFVYVIEGAPDVWLDGHLHRLAPGDGVGFPAGTGLAHSFLNNTDSDVRLIVVGEKSRKNKIVYPVNPERKALRTDWWHDAPARPLGPHDGFTEAGRAAKDPKA